MNTQRSILVAFILVCVFLFFSGIIVVISLLLLGDERSGVDPALQALITANAIEDAVNTQVAAGIMAGTPVADAALPTQTSVFVGEISTDLPLEDGLIVYKSVPGDTLAAISARFSVDIDQVKWSGNYSSQVFLPVGTEIRLPPIIYEGGPATWLFSDSAIVNGLSDVDFDVRQFVDQADGYLSEYQGDARGVRMDGAAIVERVANEHSISAKFLLALLEYRSGWVFNNDTAMQKQNYPIGFHATGAEGLYEELYISARLLGYGYYGWRDGSRVTLQFSDGETMRLHPGINAGTAAVENLMAGLEKRNRWEAQLFSETSLPQTYRQMFGDPLNVSAEPQIADWLSQPTLELPFPVGENYHLTSGPHRAWGLGSPWAAIDFAPGDGIRGCVVSPFWITASAAGYVVRSENGVVVIDLDGDGWEQTGWVLFYLHLAEKERVPAGTWVKIGDRLGHASCEGGIATGSHVHLARKYNGEWMPAAGPIPMNLSGWIVESGKSEYQGQLVRDLITVVAYPSSNAASLIAHD